MVDFDGFEGRLADALRDYAAEAPTDVDALPFAQAIAATRVSRRRSPVVWVLIAAMLILAALVALAAVGAWRERDLSLEPALSIPDALGGDWQASISDARPGLPIGIYTLNLSAQTLVRDPDGKDVDRFGRVGAFVPSEPGVRELVVQSAGPCGVGQYLLRDYPAGGIRFTDAIDSCADRVAILRDALVWVRPDPTPLVAGTTYGSGTFTEPFHFAMFASEQGPKVGDVAGFADRWGSDGGFRIRYGCCWDTWFVDDQPVGTDVCDPSSGTLPDIPATPAAVGDWLRSSDGLTIAKPIEITVDGRTALRFDVTSFDITTSGSKDCSGSGSPPVGFRFYAIPTRDDTILFVLWGDEGSVPMLGVGADDLVRSMTFD